MFGSPSVGDHVRLRETHRRLLGGDVRRNQFGIVKERHYGLFSSDITVEMANGGTVRLPASKMRRTGGSGDGGARRFRQDLHQAKLFAGVILFVPAAIALARFFLAGGQPSELVLALLESVLDTAFALLAGPFGGFIALVAVVVAARFKFSRR